MLQSKLFGKTLKNPPKDEVSVNAKLLAQAGFIDKLSAGIYSYLPLGLKVLNKIKQITREEMDAIGGQEILMPTLQPAEPWKTTGRWDDPGKEVMFQFEGRSGKDFGLGWTHEEIVTPLAKKFISSYKDLPVYVYQIQDKFRNEPRAKSGLLRGIEFSMKDLYSFHRDEKDLEKYYQKALEAYQKVFKRCGLDALVVEASGGSFSKYSHEFQVLTPNGEDTIFYCEKCRYAQNKEIADVSAISGSVLGGGGKCPKCGGKIMAGKTIEVGNIFQLKTKYSAPFKLEYADEKGQPQPVVMGCYGIGPSRVMGAIAEIYHDKNGIIWPQSVAPFQIHLISLQEDKKAGKIYDELKGQGIEVLFDDRDDSAGAKFADADLIGIPYRVVVSKKTGDGVEVKKRGENKVEVMKINKLIKTISI
ncbi:MAG: aminoacyl--tRNA ligase-related protein [Patescibacteria group bacterium]